MGRSRPVDHDSNCATLIKVLKEGCISYPPHVLGWGDVKITYDPSKRLVDGDLVAPELVCFCDIPDHALEVHVRKYGHFGLSLKREYLVRHGARPVTYFPYDPRDLMSVYGITALSDIEATIKGLREQIDDAGWKPPRSRHLGEKPATMPDAVSLINSCVALHMLAYTKPFNAALSPDDSNNYYMEREWRRVGNMMFEPQHVEEVRVAAGFGAKVEAALPIYTGRILEMPAHP